jgi:cell division protein FtsB
MILLNLLCLFQLAYREEKHGIMKYKITLNVEARKTLLIQELEEAKAKVTYLEDEISKLNFINN